MSIIPDRREVVLRHILERNAQSHPDKECFVFEDGEKWSYAQTLSETYRAANALSEIGVKGNENVLIFLLNSQDWIRAWFGVNALGAVIVPVNTAYKGEMLKHICNDSQARHLVTTTDLADRVKETGLKLNVVDPSVLVKGANDEPNLDHPIEPWDIQAIIYTSGTTGPSKGVISPYFQTYGGCYHWLMRITIDDTILVDLPLFHISGLYQTYAFLIKAARIVMRNVFSGSRYLEIARKWGITASFMVGTMPEFLAKSPVQPDDADNPLRVVFCAPLPNDTEGFKKRFGLDEVISCYGMTETGITTIVEGTITDPKSCGKAKPGNEIRLVDENDIPVPTGQVGELIIRTDLPWQMNLGYWGRPEETATAWRNGWFHTGDLLYCDEDGNYYFADRKKDAIRRRGENISSFEVEREVMAFMNVLETVCVSAPGEFAEDEVKVFVVPRQGTQIDPAKLIQFLIPRMPYFMVPRYIEIVDELPKTPTNKVMKFELRGRGNSERTWDREAAGIKVTRNS